MTASPRVLLIDDERELLTVLSERLELRGMVVQTADNGEDALKLVEETAFDAVVLDLAMPGLDGIETLRRMKEIRPAVQVILLTGQATVQKSIEVMKLGAMDLLEKPADLKVLLAKIEEASSNRAELRDKQMEDDIDDIIRKRGW
jgi:two-component system, OmpR family, response regulator